MRKMLTIAIPAVLAAGLVAAAVNEPDTELTASERGQVKEEPGPAVIEVPATEPTTTTTVAPPPPETTTTTVAPPATTATTVKVTPTTRPRTQTTSAAPKPAAKPQVDCGTGTALANVEGYDTGSDYRIRVTIINKTNKHIEIDALSFTAVYDTGERSFNLPVAGQRVIASADPQNNPTTVVIEVPDSASPKPPSAFSPPKFSFHTAGHPECASA